jgi:hypothetical protein
MRAGRCPAILRACASTVRHDPDSSERRTPPTGMHPSMGQPDGTRDRYPLPAVCDKQTRSVVMDHLGLTLCSSTSSRFVTQQAISPCTLALPTDSADPAPERVPLVEREPDASIRNAETICVWVGSPAREREAREHLPSGGAHNSGLAPYAHTKSCQRIALSPSNIGSFFYAFWLF